MKTTPYSTAASRPLTHISQTIQIRRGRQALWSTEEFIRNVPLWTPTHGHTSAAWSAKTYIHLHYADTACCLKNFPRTMTDDAWELKNTYYRHVLMIMMISKMIFNKRIDKFKMVILSELKKHFFVVQIVN